LKLRAVLDNHDCEVVIEYLDGKLRITVDGQIYSPDVHKLAQRSYLLINEHRVYDCRVEGKSRERFEVIVNKHVYGISIVDPRRLRTDENSDRHHHGSTEIAAQMPGKVVRVLVESGPKSRKVPALSWLRR
jgi:biotin carboxyl carrier protein